MPTYCFTSPDGLSVELTMPVSQWEKVRQPDGSFQTKEGARLVRNYAAERRSVSSIPGAWPMESDALAVLPGQVQSVRESYARAGISVDFAMARDGFSARPILRDRNHRRQVLRANKVHDKDGGYGD